MIFIFNSQDVTEDDLRLLFSNAGGTVKAFKFFQYVHLFHSNKSHVTTEQDEMISYNSRRSILKSGLECFVTLEYIVVDTIKIVVFFRDRKMALIQMSTVEEAIQALIDLHNYNMGGNQHLRVSFSKSTI